MVRTALLVALAIALALVLWWSQRDERARAERPALPREGITPPTLPAETGEAPPPAEEATETYGTLPDPVEVEDEDDGAEPADPLPPDPVEQGECALFVRLVDAATGAPVESSIDLWRLNAPGNEHWLDGDQLQLRTDIAQTGTTLRDLPEGDYRPVCAAQRFAAEDPPPVSVLGPLTEVTIQIELPRPFHVRLRLFDANGHPLPEAAVRRSGGGWTQRDHAPAWRKRRDLRDPPASTTGLFVGRGGASSMGLGGRAHAQPQPAAGYTLGPVAESPKHRALTHSYRAEVEGLSDVSLSIRGDRADERTYVGVMAPIETLVRDVRLPDGRPAAAAGARIYAWCSAVLAEEATRPDFWRHLEIDVSVEMPGYKRLRFEHRLADPPPVHILDPE